MRAKSLNPINHPNPNKKELPQVGLNKKLNPLQKRNWKGNNSTIIGRVRKEGEEDLNRPEKGPRVAEGGILPSLMTVATRNFDPLYHSFMKRNIKIIKIIIH